MYCRRHEGVNRTRERRIQSPRTEHILAQESSSLRLHLLPRSRPTEYRSSRPRCPTDAGQENHERGRRIPQNRCRGVSHPAASPASSCPAAFESTWVLIDGARLRACSTRHGPALPRTASEPPWFHFSGFSHEFRRGQIGGSDLSGSKSIKIDRGYAPCDHRFIHQNLR